MFGLNRRKKYLIYPPFQLALLLANVISVLACLAVFATLLGTSFNEMIQLGQQAGFPEGHPYFQFLSVQGATVVHRLLAAVSICLVLNTVLFIWLSHRLVGPIYGMKLYLLRAIEAKKRGETVPPITFRKNDFFKDLAVHLNEALGTKKEGP